MNNPAYPVLCGGTFLTQLLQSRKRTASHRQRNTGKKQIVSKSRMYCSGLFRSSILTIYCLPVIRSRHTPATYKNCAKNTPDDLKFDNEQVISTFQKRLSSDYPTELNKMTGFVRQFIRCLARLCAQKDVLLVKRLIELIRDDESISKTATFIVAKNSTAVTKADLINSTDEIYLPAFLLDLWRFIVTERKDTTLNRRENDRQMETSHNTGALHRN